MAKPVKLSDELVHEAGIYAQAQDRSIPKQIERWARIGKAAEENPDIPMGLLNDILLAQEEVKAGIVSEYTFG